jgi:hypothetical protein
VPLGVGSCGCAEPDIHLQSRAFFFSQLKNTVTKD